MKYKANNTKSIHIGENIMDMCCNNKELSEQFMCTWDTELDIFNFKDVTLAIDGDDISQKLEY